MSDAPIDIGARRSEYRPVRATLDGTEYFFGQSALQVYRALHAGADLKQKEGEPQTAYVTRLLEALPVLVESLCPTFPPAPWSVDQEMALFEVVTEVLKRAGEIRFQAAEG